MDIPSEQILAPTSPVDDLANIPAEASVVACYGRARHLDRLIQLQGLESLWISGVPGKAAEVVAQLRPLRKLVVYDWRVESCELLSGLRDLESLAICQSPKLRGLTGLDALTSLMELILFDNCNYTTLKPLAKLESLEVLCLEGGFSKPLRIESLAPIAGLAKLVRLRAASIRVDDKSLRPLHRLPRLRDVFIADVFAPAEFRDLATALPHAKGEWLDTNGRAS